MSLQRRIGATLTVLVSAALLSAPTAAAESPLNAAALDRVSITGYNFEVKREADVVAGNPDSALRITYTAGRPLTDGTVRILLPRQQWPSTLRTVAGFNGNYPFSGEDRAGVSVLPAELLPLAGPACTGAGDEGVIADGDWSVQSSGGFQVITVRHASCAAGAQLVVRLKGVTAPARVGTAYLPVIVTQPGGAPRLAVGAVDVKPVPQVSLGVTIPAQGEILAGQPFEIYVLATGPNGPVSDYDGAVAVVSEPEDCTLNPRDGSVAHQFTPGVVDLAQITVSVSQTVAHRLRVYDVTNQALDGISQPFDVVDVPVDPGTLICPASFH